jgi:hypothetical protein
MGASLQDMQQSQSPWMQHPKRWPLVNTLTSRDGSFLKDARLVNAYAEKDPVTQEFQIEKRPGFSLTAAVTSGVSLGGSGVPIPGGGGGQGLYTYNQFSSLFGPESTTIYLQGPVGGPTTVFVVKIDQNGVITGPTRLGNVLLNGQQKAQFIGLPFSATTGRVTPGTVLFSGGSPLSQLPGPSATGQAYYYDNSVGALQTLIPGTNGWPLQTVPGFVYLDGFTYVMDITGTIWETATQGQIANWGVLAFIQAGTDADIGVQLARQLIYVVAIKQWTTQFFYDAGNQTGSSLSPVPGAQYEFGCLSSDTFQDLDGVLFWATQSKNSTCRIVMMDNLNAKFVSNPAVERQLDLGPGSTWYSLVYQHAGHRWYVITNISTNVTMVYDIGQDLWYLWTDPFGNFYPIISRAATMFGKEWQQRGDTGAIYQMDSDYVYPNDSGLIVPVDIYTPNYDAGVDRIKTLSQMRFNADQTPGSSMWVRFSDNDYNSFNNFRKVDLSLGRPLLNDEGSFYRRAYHFRHYANTKFRMRSVDLQMDIGTL